MSGWDFPPLADGFKFHSMTVFAKKREAYDTLTEADGWTERFSHAEDGSVKNTWKTLGPWPGGYIAVHAPDGKRPEVVLVASHRVTARMATHPPVTDAEDEAWAGWTQSANSGAA